MPFPTVSRKFLHTACCVAATAALLPALARGHDPLRTVRERADLVATESGRADVLGPVAEAESRRLASLAGADFVAAVRSLAAGGPLPAATRERLLHESVLRIGQGPLEDPAELELLRELSSYKSQATYMEPACRTDVEQALFPVAEAARQALDERIRREGQAEGERLFAAGDLRALIGQLSEERGPFAQGMIDAVYRGERITQVESAILGMNPVLVTHEPVATLLEGCCAVTRDPRTEERLIRHAPERIAIRVLGWVHTHGVGEAMPLFEAGISRTETASAAVVAMGSLAGTDGPARERLIALLADEDLGGAAALALSRCRDPQLVERLGAMLLAEPSRTVQARLALALRLERSPRAAELLAAFAGRPDADASLRAEVAGR